jgi:hypothetical protein
MGTVSERRTMNRRIVSWVLPQAVYWTRKETPQQRVCQPESPTLRITHSPRLEKMDLVLIKFATVALASIIYPKTVGSLPPVEEASYV